MFQWLKVCFDRSWEPAKIYPEQVKTGPAPQHWTLPSELQLLVSSGHVYPQEPCPSKIPSSEKVPFYNTEKKHQSINMNPAAKQLFKICLLIKIKTTKKHWTEHVCMKTDWTTRFSWTFSHRNNMSYVIRP